jgi:hypothetical protein
MVLELDAPEPPAIAQAPSASGELAHGNVIPLEASVASFWVRNYKKTRLGIDYEGSSRGSRPFLRLTIPERSLYRWPNGRTIGPWDAARITVQVDSTELVVHFAPSGLRFTPACEVLLELWYDGANLGRGKGDDDDDEFLRGLRLWHQVEPGGGWAPIPAYHRVRGHYILARICGFSSYAVSF